MSEKLYAGEAGPATPEAAQQDPFGGFQRDDYRLKAVQSRNEAAKAIAKTHAWAGVLRAAVVPATVATVIICAMTLDVPVPVPWPLALAALLGKVPGQ